LSTVANCARSSGGIVRRICPIAARRRRITPWRHIARALGADLDVLAVRRLTLPGQPDRPWGAVAALGDCMQVVAEPDTHRHTAAESGDTVRQRDLTELRQLEDTYRAGRPPERVTGRLVVVVGDGLASLAAMRAAAAVRRHRALRATAPGASGFICVGEYRSV
jgi:predicted phosphoribosyltransferase